MNSNIFSGSFALAQPESLAIPLIPAQPGTGFVSKSPAYDGGDFTSFGAKPPPVSLSVFLCHASPVQMNHGISYVPHTASPNINDFYTSFASLWRVATTASITTPPKCCNSGNNFSNVTTVLGLYRILIVGLCILAPYQLIFNIFRILSLKLILLIRLQRAN